jgi:hypothetical protein
MDIKTTANNERVFRGKWILPLLMVLLSGCAISTLKEGLPLLVGQTLDDAVDIFGLPDSSMQMGDRTIYVWGSSQSFSMPVTTLNTSTTTGSVGSAPAYGTTTSTSTSYVPVNYTCSIKLSVNTENRITHWDFKGNEGGCYSYANKIENIIPDD